MGGSSYNDDIYRARVTHSKTTGTDMFAHDAAVKSGAVAMAVHPLLDPSRPNTFKKIIRESFDSDVHPNSRAVAVIFDVTGSMASVPRVFVSKLDKLMSSLVKKGFLASPHVLFGAVGDAKSDVVPLQIGQFEGGNEMDEALTNIVLEGGGGGQNTESYELALYFMARHTDMHCYTKRGQKGFLFLMGDERPYPVVRKSEVKTLIGDDLQADIPFEDILAEAREKFEVFWLMPGGTNHFDDHTVIDPLKKWFGQNFIKMPNPADVVETICSIIGVAEGFDIHEVGAALKDVGADAAAVDRASRSVVAYAGTKAVAKGAVVSGGALVEKGRDKSVTRL